MQKNGTALLSTSLAWPAVAGCSRAETFSQLSAISFAQPCRTSKEPLIGVIVENYSKYELQEPRSNRVETNLSSVDPGTSELFVCEREGKGLEVGQF